MTMMFFILILLFFGLWEWKDMTGDDVCCLCETAVCANDLGVDPPAIGSGEEGDDACDIVGRTEPLKRCHAADLFDLLFSLTVQEELRPHKVQVHMAFTVILCPRSSLART